MPPPNDTLELQALQLFERALERPYDERVEWIQNEAGSNEILVEKTLALLRRDQSAGQIMYTGQAIVDTIDDIESPTRIGAYKITRLIGRGGMGAVYRGERDKGDFEHTAAIKVIRTGIMSEKLIERFSLERQTLANLAHPNIARLYDGGTLDDGAPYIIMEFIDGAPITDWVNDKTLDISERIKLFWDVCAAVAYAHQNQIVHRDITPSNVLITHEGEVKLIDFGIAKPYAENTESESVPGSLASLSFTPGFAAPERAQGDPANTLSDIYSLGKLLTALLPDNTKQEELTAICNKAASISPQDRYPSVDALSDDIRRYMSGSAVQAYGGNSTYHLGKFVNRNKLAVSFASLAAVGLIAGLIITTTLYRQAEAATQEAQARFDDVRQLANTMMFDVYEEIERVPGTIEGQQKLVNSAQKYLDNLANDKRATIELRQEAVEGHIQLARITGSPKGGSLFDIETANKHLETASDLLSGISVENQNKKTLNLLGRLNFRRAEISIDPDAKLEQALSELETSEGYYEKAIAADPDNFNLKLEAVSPASIKAVVLLRQNKKEEAEASAKTGIELVNALLKAQPDNREALRVRSGALRTLGEVLTISGKFEESLEPLSQSIKDQDILVPEGQYDYAVMRGKMIAHWRRAFALANLKRNEEAVEEYEEAIALAELNLARDPMDPDAKRALIIYQGEIFLPYSQLGRFAEAEEALGYTLDYYETEYQKEPDQARTQRSMLVQHYQMAELFKAANDDSKRCHHITELLRFKKIMVEAETMTASDAAALDEYFEANSDC